ncbi:MAG: hypothetical protein LBD08_04425 [Treponema sp.]|jgi:hypothetical protein|nr:hypothetical protein [Treponema sp.]
MKRRFCVFVLIGIAFCLSAQQELPEYQFASGSWEIDGERLYQRDAGSQLAKVNFRVSQSGSMIYEFNVRYEGGAADGHGGFGLHLYGDEAHPGASWGSGKSYLIWFNYDEHPRSLQIPAGFSMQLYRSLSHSRMELLESLDLNEYIRQLPRNFLAAPAPVRIIVFGDTGEIRVYEPGGADRYFTFQADRRDIPLKGSWVTLRTNGITLSFGF